MEKLSQLQSLMETLLWLSELHIKQLSLRHLKYFIFFLALMVL